MPKRKPSRYARLQALIRNPEYLSDLELLRKGYAPSNIKDKDSRAIPAEDLRRLNLNDVPNGFSRTALDWFLDKYKLSIPITLEVFKSRKRSAWNKIGVFTDDVYRTARKPSPQQAITEKTYGEKTVLKSKPLQGFEGIGPAVLTPAQKEELWLGLDKKYERRFRTPPGDLKDAPEKDSWKSREYERATGQKWGDPTSPSAFTDGDLTDLLEQVGLEIGKESRMKMVDALNMYLSTKDVLDGLPRPSQVASVLMQLKELAGSFDRALGELDFVSRSLLRKHAERIDIEKVRAQARMVAEGCIDALKSLAIDKGGRPKDLAIKTLISQIADIWKHATGKAPTLTWNDYSDQYEGKFFRFIRSCLQSADPKAGFKNEALGQKIRTVLRTRKTE
jgi:hypothetical protein